MKKTTAITVLLALLVSACSASDEASDDPFPREEPRVSRDRSSEPNNGFRVDERRSTQTTVAAAEQPAAEEAFPATDFEDRGVSDPEYVEEDGLSTFALDVDTGSYTIGRSYLYEGFLPEPDSVRVEEWINFFAQDYRVPRPGEAFTLSIDGGQTPFTDERTRMLRIGIRAEDVEERPPSRLTFVVDTSGSMHEGDRLEIVKESLSMLVEGLDGDDVVTIVEFGSDAELVLPPTFGDDQLEILAAIARLSPGGSTNFEDALRLGYGAAEEMFSGDAINRVVVASDGVANVGLTEPDELIELIRDSADRGITMVSVGVGLGNYNDVLLEQLADDGDGFYAYVDTRAEAEDLFVRDLTGTLLTVAEDARVQVEFDPDAVISWRLVGYENRAIDDDDFRNDSVDAGELGAGHTVTALYELRLSSSAMRGEADRLGRVNLRWLDPATDDPRETSLSFGIDDLEARYRDTEPRFQMNVVVAQFAELLRRSEYIDIWEAGELIGYARDVEDQLPRDDDVAELVGLIEMAVDLGA